MDDLRLELFWDEIPVGKENAVDYDELSQRWNKSEREVRRILHFLSLLDNGDDFILIRSAKNKGFFKTTDKDEIEAYKKECLQKGRSVFAPIKKINRVMSNNAEQFNFENNLRTYREMTGLPQKAVCEYMQKFDEAVDPPLLSKFENGACLPTPFQLSKLAALYGVQAQELINGDFFEMR